MIENFEKHTQPLSDLDKALGKVIAVALSSSTKPKTAQVLADIVNTHFSTTVNAPKCTELKVRKIISNMRQTGNYAICSSSHGFWVNDDPNVLDSQIRSFNQRIAAISAARDGLIVCRSNAIRQHFDLEASLLDQHND
jgi:ribosomal protein L31